MSSLRKIVGIGILTAFSATWVQAAWPVGMNVSDILDEKGYSDEEKEELIADLEDEYDIEISASGEICHSAPMAHSTALELADRLELEPQEVNQWIGNRFKQLNRFKQHHRKEFK